MVNTSLSSNSSTLFSDLIHETVLTEELHPYQLKAITNLFKQVFLTTAGNRPQAKNIVDRFFHVCSGQ